MINFEDKNLYENIYENNIWEDLYYSNQEPDIPYIISLLPDMKSWQNTYWISKILYRTDKIELDNYKIMALDKTFELGISIEDKEAYLDTIYMYMRINCLKPDFKSVTKIGNVLYKELDGTNLPDWWCIYQTCGEIHDISILKKIALNPEPFWSRMDYIKNTSEENLKKITIISMFYNNLKQNKLLGEIDEINVDIHIQKGLEHNLNNQNFFIDFVKFFKGDYEIPSADPNEFEDYYGFKLDIPKEESELEKLKKNNELLMIENNYLEDNIYSLRNMIDYYFDYFIKAREEIKKLKSDIDELYDINDSDKSEYTKKEDEFNKKIKELQNKINNFENTQIPIEKLREERKEEVSESQRLASKIGIKKKILVMGDGDKSIIVEVANKYGFKEKNLKLYVEYLKLKHNFKRINIFNNRYMAIVFGPMPHSVCGKGDYSSIINRVYNESDTFSVESDTKTGKLKFTKEGLNNAFKIIKERFSFKINGI